MAKREIIKIFDNEAKYLKDKITMLTEKIENNEDSIRPKGFVTIIDKDSGEYLVKDQQCDIIEKPGKNNLIVWVGREIVPQVLFARDRVSNSNERNLRIYWLSLGSGGADPANPLNPIAPDTSNTGLNNEIIINANNPNYAHGGRKKPFDSITFEADPENNNRFLIAKVTTTILYQEANNQDLNEAALWFSNSNVPASATTFRLFSRVTFSTIRKTQDRELILVWYIFF